MSKRYYRFSDRMISAEKLRLASRVAERAAQKHGIAKPSIYWFDEEKQGDWGHELDYENFLTDGACFGYCAPKQFPGVIWIHKDRENEGLVETVVHECCHLSGTVSEEEAGDCGKKWRKWYEVEGKNEGTTYYSDHRPQPWERPPEAKYLKFGDILVTPYGTFKNYSAALNGALWSEITN
jgi:hypothetical protein